MSSIADLRIIDTAHLDALAAHARIKTERKFLFLKKKTDTYYTFLETHSSETMKFNWSGDTFTDIIIFLEDKRDIHLANNEFTSLAEQISTHRENAVFILTYAQRMQYLDRLHPDTVSPEELLAFNKEFARSEAPELIKAELDGLWALYESLVLLTDNSRVILLSIG